MKKSLLFGILFLLTSNLKSQITVNDNVNATDLANALAGAGVIVSGATLNCAIDTVNGNGFGLFSVAGPSIIGFTEGVALTSGHARTIVGPNDFTTSSALFFPSITDADLEAMTSDVSSDACVLEMDIIPSNDTLFFEYQFGSEEYLEYVGTFNDAFALWISGPGIAGTQNLAVVPGTAGTFVSINNINDVTNSTFYQNNGDGLALPPLDSTLRYDGLTTILPAKVAVIPCSSYHLKIAICDIFDASYDSGVFIKAGSLSSFGIDVEQTTQFGDSIFNAAVEGCNNGIISFSRTPITSFPAVINYIVGGTASPGADYTALSSTISIPAGVGDTSITIVPIVDGITEGNETIIIYLTNTCGALTYVYDSVTLVIQDKVTVQANYDTTICTGFNLNLQATGGTSYIWSPSTGLNNNLIANPICTTPSGITNYTVTTTVGLCTDTEAVTITGNNTINAIIRPDTVLCILGSVPLYASLTPQPYYTYQWVSPNVGDIANPLALNTTATPNATTTYTLIITDTLSGCNYVGEAKVLIGGDLEGVFLSDNVTICRGETAPLIVSGGTNWNWAYDATLTCATCSTTVASPKNTTLYFVKIFNEDGCYKYDSILVTVKQPININVSPSYKEMYKGESVNYTTTGFYTTISWQPSLYLNDTLISEPTSTPDGSIVYLISAYDTDSVCYDQDTVIINFLGCQGFKMPTAFTPNGDNENDILYANTSGFETFISMKIYNRWGENIFETTNIGNGWNGTYKGVQQEVGTYVCVIEGNCENKKIQLKSNVSILR